MQAKLSRMNDGPHESRVQYFPFDLFVHDVCSTRGEGDFNNVSSECSLECQSSTCQAYVRVVQWMLNLVSQQSNTSSKLLIKR